MPNPYDLGPSGLEAIRDAVCARHGEPGAPEPRCAHAGCDVRGDRDMSACDCCNAETCAYHLEQASGLFLCQKCSNKERNARAVACFRLEELISSLRSKYAGDAAAELRDIANDLEKWDIE
jgi:hypothetical protein